ncbi:MAG: Bug family tripartite tricarboxylate transporter substrate binding protein [Burkholderiaceae bacterium]
MRKGSLSISRRTAVQSMLGLAAAYSAGVHAQRYPERVITFVVQAAPGGSSDLTARVMAEKLSQSLGVSVVVMNDPRAAGALAVRRVVSAPADGYTMLMLGTKSAIAESLGKSGSYDLLKDLSTVAVISSGELAIVTDEKSPYADLGALVRTIRAQPGKLTIGVGDVNGGIQHLGAELFKKAIQGDFVIVPYVTSAALSTAVRGGQIDAAFELLPPVMSQIKSKAIKALAITGRQRYPDIPGVPTIAEAGFPNCEVVTNSFIAVPAQTPAAIVERLNAEINQALRQSDLQARSKARGSGVPEPATPAQSSKLLANEIAKWREIVQSANVRIE